MPARGKPVMAAMGRSAMDASDRSDDLGRRKEKDVNVDGGDESLPFAPDPTGRLQVSRSLLACSSGMNDASPVFSLSLEDSEEEGAEEEEEEEEEKEKRQEEEQVEEKEGRGTYASLLISYFSILFGSNSCVLAA
ncbi:unnamed protein product [Linum tenue]|uniref:Uncharacterized protein n=1 Tax=Linum tenue TaxID=586396 RepID=A0AAV0LVI1_9ROSI|nr:unnamed protein product [Linum tenue]